MSARRWLVLLLVAVVSVIGIVVTGGHARAGSCAAPSGPFHTSGTQIVAGNGSRFVPYGVTVSGIEHTNWPSYKSADIAQINAAATTWCANVVRLQVSPLLGQAAYRQAVKDEVSAAEADGMVVVINYQTEWVGLQNLPGPAARTFWKTITGMFGSDHQVMFDLFNEPRGGATWPAWHSAMQSLASYVRSRAPNVEWIETPGMAKSLSGVPAYPITTSNVVYEFHHPAGPHNSTAWWHDFGFMLSRYGRAPIVDGEWAQFAAARGECWSDAPTKVGKYIGYLTKWHIGLTAWTLLPGDLIASADYANPTHIKPSWACTGDPFNGTGLNQGAGSILRNWFQRQNG